MTTPLEEPIRQLDRGERLLWVFAVLSYGVGDTVSTYLGLSLGRAAEAGPIAAPVVSSHGVPGLIALKLTTLAVFYLSWVVVDTSSRVAIPVAVTVVGVGVTAWNLVVVFG